MIGCRFSRFAGDGHANTLEDPLRFIHDPWRSHGSWKRLMDQAGKSMQTGNVSRISMQFVQVKAEALVKEQIHSL